MEIKDFEKISELYAQIKEDLLIFENTNPNQSTYQAPKDEFNKAFDHVMASIKYVKKEELEKAKRHLCRAGYDVLELSILDNILYINRRLLKPFSLEDISNALPEYNNNTLFSSKTGKKIKELFEIYKTEFENNQQDIKKYEKYIKIYQPYKQFEESHKNNGISAELELFGLIIAMLRNMHDYDEDICLLRLISKQILEYAILISGKIPDIAKSKRRRIYKKWYPYFAGGIGIILGGIIGWLLF